MRHRFFSATDLAAGALVPLSDDERHHARVVRVREGEEVEVFDGRGAGFFGIFGSDAVRLTTAAPDREAALPVVLAMAIIQLDKFELVLQKATELGVHAIVPMITARVELRPERYRGKHDRWRKIVFEAVKQSGRTRIPEIDEPQEFENIIQRPGAKIIFDADEDPRPTANAQQPTILIGPEGGFSEDELRAAREGGCAFEQLGPRRLRAETAAIFATALVVSRRTHG